MLNTQYSIYMYKIKPAKGRQGKKANAVNSHWHYNEQALTDTGYNCKLDKMAFKI